MGVKGREGLWLGLAPPLSFLMLQGRLDLKHLCKMPDR